jgi:hypothetical protein
LHKNQFIINKRHTKNHFAHSPKIDKKKYLCPLYLMINVAR